MTNPADKLDRFTRRARTALTRAKAIAISEKQLQILPDHLLQALLHDTTGEALSTLAAVGVDPLQLRQQLKAAAQITGTSATQQPKLSPALKAAIAQAVQEAIREHGSYISTRHLLQGIVAHGEGAGTAFLQTQGISIDILRAIDLNAPVAQNQVHQARLHQFKSLRHYFTVSPLFWGLLLSTIGAGYLTYNPPRPGPWWLFLFVTLGWLLSVVLHEWGHATVAYWGGDHTVAIRGYLTLNPLRYVEPMYSIVLPLVFLFIGGVALPGAAVYINESSIRRRAVRSLASLAGIGVNSICALLLAIPFLLGWQRATLATHYAFWCGLALILWLELYAILLCLLPLPGFDGFGALQPYLPRSWVNRLRGYAASSYLILIILFLRVPPVRQSFFFVLDVARQLLHIDPQLVSDGWRLFHFWGPFF